MWVSIHDLGVIQLVKIDLRRYGSECALARYLYDRDLLEDRRKQLYAAIDAFKAKEIEKDLDHFQRRIASVVSLPFVPATDEMKTSARSCDRYKDVSMAIDPIVLKTLWGVEE